MSDQNIVVYSPAESDIKIIKWKVREGFSVTNSQVILLYKIPNSEDTDDMKRLKSTKNGVVKKRLVKEGALVTAGQPILELSECIHTTVIHMMCADCGADLRQNENGNPSEASVPMVHSVPELKVSQKLAQKLGHADTIRLLGERKLVLLVDLDQTVIHTTNDNVPNNIRAIYHFQLYGPNSPWYHTRLRPGTLEFLNNIASFFELHICTFGARNYAHTIAQFLDPDGKHFSHRILSRDECLNITSKTDNLKALFPCGDSMVCIIDDREDVWNMASNLIQVKPYHFFQHTGDINAPPGHSKHELDGKGHDYKDLEDMAITATHEEEVHKQEAAEEAKNLEEAKKHEDSSKQPDKKSDIDKTEKNINDSEETPKSSSSDSSEEKSELECISSQNKPSDECDDDHEKPEPEIKPEENKKIKANIKPQDELIDIEDPDDYLLHLEAILKKIHANFYEIHDNTKEIPDLKILIPRIRAKVLCGKNLVFSGLVPNHMKLEQSRAYLIAKSLGANISQNLNDQTTHLVAATAGTFKVNAARKRREVHIVTPDWLWSCAERWEHVDERLFPLDPHKPSKMRQPPAHCHSPEHVINYNEKSEILTMAPPMATEEEEKFSDTINPLLSFSNADLAAMNQDVDQFFESDSSSGDEPVNIENPPLDKHLRKRKRQEEKEERRRQFFSRSDANTSLLVSRDNPEREAAYNEEEEDDNETISSKFRRGEDLPSDLDMGSDSNGSAEPIDQEDDGEWNMMGAALEREFLGLE